MTDDSEAQGSPDARTSRTTPIPGTRAARRVEVKHAPAGPSDKLKDKWKQGHADHRAALEAAGLALVDAGSIPTMPAVIAAVAVAGHRMSTATANRHADALEAPRRKWEEAHGRVPDWHRGESENAQQAGTAPAATVDGATPAKAPGRSAAANSRIEDLEAELAVVRGERDLWKRRYERAMGERAKANGSRNRLAAENARLREENRRLGEGVSEDE